MKPLESIRTKEAEVQGLIAKSLETQDFISNQLMMLEKAQNESHLASHAYEKAYVKRMIFETSSAYSKTKVNQKMKLDLKTKFKDMGAKRKAYSNQIKTFNTKCRPNVLKNVRRKKIYFLARKFEENFIPC